MSLWKYVTEKGEAEIFIKTGHKAASVLIYLLLNHFGEKAIMKNPKNMDSAICFFPHKTNEKIKETQ